MPDRDKRYRKRYAMEIPVSVRWRDRSGHARDATGKTKNMSPFGAFLVCDSRIEKGCAIDVHFNAPIALGGCIPSRIFASGTVVRGVAEEEHAASHGHGVMFDHFSFARL
jgi:hypothetical protein